MVVGRLQCHSILKPDMDVAMWACVQFFFKALPRILFLMSRISKISRIMNITMRKSNNYSRMF